MSNLSWGIQRSLENSLAEFLSDSLSNDNLTVKIDGKDKPVSIRIGHTPDDTWELPVISLYADQRLSPRGFVGSNLRLKSYLIILDIRALDTGMQQDLADWLEETINDGFPYFEYEPSSDPLNPTATQKGYVSIDFLTNNAFHGGNNVDLLDKYRQNISISCVIEC
jgi:hypothetical protein